MPAMNPPQQYAPLAVGFSLIAGVTFVYIHIRRAWLRTFNVMFLALGKSRQLGLVLVWPTWQSMPPTDSMLLSTPAMDHLILLIVVLWLCAGLNRRKRNIDFRKYPNY
eukprot:2519835-Pleurochrysis_carterae.AAC.1